MAVPGDQVIDGRLHVSQGVVPTTGVEPLIDQLHVEMAGHCGIGTVVHQALLQHLRYQGVVPRRRGSASSVRSISWRAWLSNT